MAVERGHAHSDDLLRGKSVDALSPADRHLVTALVLGVLRWQILLDQRIRSLLKKPNAKLDAEESIALRLGAFQLLFLDRIPAHAAIGESVELVLKAGHRYASGMVNAILRRVARFDSLDQGLEESAVLAHPTWMIERWVSHYGVDAANAICRHGQAQPTLTVRMENAEAEQELTQAGIELAPGELLAGARTVVSGDVTLTAAFAEGRVRIQDEGSQLIGELAAASFDHAERILDACAAPGGKTLILAERNRLAHIVAYDENTQRLEQLSNRLAALAPRVECRLADATEPEEDAIFDAALADVPCSGTGTLGRNPEIRHRLKPEDLSRQAERQRAILKATLRAVRPGGRVAYSTCSLEPEENEQVVAQVLAETPGVRQISLEGPIDSLLATGVLTAAGADGLRGCLMPEGAFRLLPGATQSDGFFIALIEKLA
jgi:16S rRNA (cytosine967-C5)-methyltransferase